MKNEQAALLHHTFAHVTEAFAFMFVRLPREDEAFPRGEAPFLQVSMGFSGGVHGALSLIAPEALAMALTANVLGEEESTQPITEDPADALKELMNITCGEVVLALQEAETPYSLLVPRANTISQKQWDTLLMNDQWMRCLMDAYPVLLTLRLQE